MRHDQISARDAYGEADIAAVWPVGIQLIPLPIPEIERLDGDPVFRSAPAVPDVPAAVGKLIVGSYAALIAAFAIATVGSRDSIFTISISALFVVMYFLVPRLMLGIEPESGVRPSFDRFMRDGMDTLTGHSSGKAALVQILIVPVFLTLAVLTMGIAAAIIM